MSNYENAAFLISFVSYSIAIILYLAYVVNKHEKIGRLAAFITAWGWGIKDRKSVV